MLDIVDELWSLWPERNARIFNQVFLSKDNVAQLVAACIAKWASSKDEFDSSKVGGIIHNREASLGCRCTKAPSLVVWAPPKSRFLKFNVDGSD